MKGHFKNHCYHMAQTSSVYWLSHTLRLKSSQIMPSLKETKIIDRFSNGEKDVTRECSFLSDNGSRFSPVLHRALSPPSSSTTAEAAQGHERLEAKWRPPVYPPWKPSHALSSTWGIWWKPFVSTPLNYQPEEEPLMLSSDNGSQQPADYSAH